MTQSILSGAVLLGIAAAATAQPAEKPAAAAAQAAEKPAVTATTPPVAVTPQPAKVTDPVVIKNDSSYALGLRTGGNFLRQYGRFGITADDLQKEQFEAGFMAALQGDEPALSEDKLQAAMQALGEMLQNREKSMADANLEAGKKFLEENGKREGVTTTDSGLQYQVLAKGGEEKYVAPAEGANVRHQFMVNYRGTLIDGSEFDKSPEGKPAPMTLQVVPGFKEALTTMPVGAKWKLFLPSDLAYGKQRRSDKIGPNSVLIFELELVEIKETTPPQRPKAVSQPVRVPPLPKQPAQPKPQPKKD